MSNANPRIFTGEYRHGIDPKHRITIPSAWRSGEGDEFYLRIDSTGSSISVMPAEEYRAKIDLIESQPGISAREKQVFKRHFSAGTYPCSADKQGRMVVPQEYAARIGLQEEAMLVGAYGSFEIWSPAKWEQTKATEDTTYMNLAAQLGL